MVPKIKAEWSAERHAKYAAKIWQRKVEPYEFDDLLQQAHLLILLGNTDYQINLRMVKYIRFLSWAYGRGHEHVLLCAAFHGRSGKGFKPLAYHSDGLNLADLETKRKWSRETNKKRAENRKKGLCACGAEPDPGFSTCTSCRTRGRAGKWAQHKRSKRRTQERNANRRKGLCHCGRKPVPGYKQCDQCRSYYVSANGNRKARSRAEVQEAKAAGAVCSGGDASADPD